MLTIAIEGEVCSVCGELLPDRSVAIKEPSIVPSVMYDNESDTMP